MPDQMAVATMQRRNFVLEALQSLSRNGSWVTQPELVSYLQSQGYDVKKHHVLRDLKALLVVHPQLECNDNSRDGKPMRGLVYGYRWVGHDAPPETGLSISEALSLFLVEKHLKKALPASLTRSLDNLFSRAQKTLDLQKKNADARWKDKIAVVLPAQPLLPPKVDNNVVVFVHEALLKDQAIEVTYRNARENQEKLILHPLGLILREPSCYLVALCNDYDDPRQFALHRIQEVRQTDKPARKPENFSLTQFVNELGHFGSGKMITLEARVCRHLGMVLSETPLEPNQDLGEADQDGWRTLTARVRDSWQLHWWILSEGDRMAVDKPKSLRKLVGQTVANMSTLYGAGEKNF